MRGEKGHLLQVRDSVFLGEIERVLLRYEFAEPPEFLRQKGAGDGESRLQYRWKERAGHGFIRSLLPGNRQFLVCLGRFLDSSLVSPRGLFIGGALPFNEYELETPLENETGVAFYDGTRWLHVWCNVNESLQSALDPRVCRYPSDWTFLGSRVVSGSRQQVLLASAHQVVLDGQPVRIERYLLMRSGDRHLVLAMKFTNVGSGPASYIYVYGDEPWVGEYGTSQGDVGWCREGLVTHETNIDPVACDFAGYWDGGNPACGPETQTTGIANFIQWGGDFPPARVYFSNLVAAFTPSLYQVPLCSPTNRVLFIEYGPRILAPRQTDLLYFIIGMVEPDPSGSPPRKPEIAFAPGDYPLLRRGSVSVLATD